MVGRESDSIVVVGSSAGGFSALIKVVRHLPSSLPAAVLIAQHRIADGPDHLRAILSHKTEMKVAVPVHEAPVEKGTVYIAPPGCHLSLSGTSSLCVRSADRIGRYRPCANLLFSSAAECYGARTFAVVLSGMLNDGADGALNVKSVGGVVIAQEPMTCKSMSMPLSVINNGAAQFVLPPSAIAHALVSLLMVTGARDLFGVPVQAA